MKKQNSHSHPIFSPIAIFLRFQQNRCHNSFVHAVCEAFCATIVIKHRAKGNVISDLSNIFVKKTFFCFRFIRSYIKKFPIWRFYNTHVLKYVPLTLFDESDTFQEDVIATTCFYTCDGHFVTLQRSVSMIKHDRTKYSDSL